MSRSYQVLARTRRPQVFEEVIGQEEIITSLRNALRQDRLAHAYVFSGIRGIGKTTTARIFAKAINCEKRQPGATDPCNDCLSCSQIAASSDLDVIEIDAATFSKVEQIRELTESLKYSPPNKKQKIVIIDEIHRLSRQAFDALLKIIEEPPTHLTFLFATTNLEKIPTTILSRCQKHFFKKLPRNGLTEFLAKACKEENIEIDGPSLNLISESSEGSVRDALSILEHATTFGDGKVDYNSLSEILGNFDNLEVRKLITDIAAGNASEVLIRIEEFENSGRDLQLLYDQILKYAKHLLYVKLNVSDDYIDLPKDEIIYFREKLPSSDADFLIRLLCIMIEDRDRFRNSGFSDFYLRIILLKICEIRREVKIKELLEGMSKISTVETKSDAVNVDSQSLAKYIAKKLKGNILSAE